VGIPILRNGRVKLSTKLNLSKEDTLMNYIGMDTHITTLDFAVINEAGRLTQARTVATSVKGLVEFVKQVAAPRVIYMEEGTLAGWVLETCIQYGEKLVITDPKRNRWIGSSGQKEDPIDAYKLAELARGGYIKEIAHPVGQRRRFRELMQAYHDTVRMTTRIKNKIKAKFRQNGIQCTGDTVYMRRYREEWKSKLPPDGVLEVVLEGLWRQLDQSERNEEELLATAKAMSKGYPEIKKFDDVPGVGFIHAATVSAILETPHRFANKRKVWMYAGLGVMARSSGGKVYSEKLTTDYNRLLKYVVKQAAGVAIQSEDNPFRRTYLDLTLIGGMAPHRARLTVARDILATMWAMWKKGEEYNPEIREKERHKQD
jgi:transposase